MPISYSEQSPLTCPACGKDFESEVWMIVDADEREDLVEALRRGTLNVTRCPHCGNEGPVGAPLLYHNAALQRVLFAGDPSVPEHELREQARALLTLMMNNIPEELHRPYHSDIYVTEGLEGAQRVIEKDDRRMAARGRKTGAASKPEPIRQPTPATALPAQPNSDEMPPLLLGVQALVSANRPDDVDAVLAQYPQLLAPDADSLLAQFAEVAVSQREHDVAAALQHARTLLADLRRPEASTPATSNGVAQPDTPAHQRVGLHEDAYIALLQATSENELLEATRAYPTLLEPWVDSELAQQVEAALDMGDEQRAQQLEDRREALVGLRTSATSDSALVDAVRTLLAADDQDDIAIVLDAHPILLSEAAQDMLWTLASEARERGDEQTATLAVEYRALLREVRQGLEE